jgi:hypothetical protein
VASFDCVTTASSGAGYRVTRINKKKEVFFIISSEPKSTDPCMLIDEVEQAPPRILQGHDLSEE